MVYFQTETRSILAQPHGATCSFGANLGGIRSDAKSELVGFEQLLYLRQPGYGPSSVVGKSQLDHRNETGGNRGNRGQS